MPGPDYYKDLSLADAIRALAEHHIAQETRHISEFEYELLVRAAGRLYDSDRSEKDS